VGLVWWLYVCILADSICARHLSEYLSRVKYVQLRNPGHYGDLKANIEGHLMEEGIKEDGR